MAGQERAATFLRVGSSGEREIGELQITVAAQPIVRVGAAGLLIGLAILWAGCSDPSLQVAPTEAQCVPRGLGAEGLPAAWQPFADHIQACVLLEPDGTPALEVIAISAAGAELSRAPHPLILLPGGRVVGQLPSHYPQDPPWLVQLHCDAWRGGIPGRIEVHLQDGADAGHRARLTLRWNARQGLYESSESHHPATH